jgi:hypothetical protein
VLLVLRLTFTHEILDFHVSYLKVCTSPKVFKDIIPALLPPHLNTITFLFESWSHWLGVYWEVSAQSSYSQKMHSNISVAPTNKLTTDAASS